MRKAIKCGKLFDSVGAKVLENKVILIEGERITDVMDGSRFKEDGQKVIDLSDKFVMPGLVECHVHISSVGEADRLLTSVTGTTGDEAIQGIKNAQTQLLAGFTTVRNLGSHGFVDVSVKKAINKGMFFGPRMVVSGPALGSTGGHCDSHFNPYLHEDNGTDSVIIDGADSARKAARYVIKHGADVVKFMATGGVMSRGTTVGSQQLTLDEMKAIIEIAQMYGVHTATHAHGTDGIKAAVIAGVTSVEHGMMMDEEIIELMAEKGTYLSPTIIAAKRIVDNGTAMGIPAYAVEKAKYVLERHEWGFRKCLANGIPIVFGTDCGTPFNFHGNQYDEFTYLCEFGMSPVQTLTAATQTGAKLLRMWDDIGSICQGKYADVIALDGDPTADVKNMAKNCFVMKGGVVYK